MIFWIGKFSVPDAEEFSGIGAAYAAGRGLGLYGDEVLHGER